jgi:hypothetical protein
MLPKKRGCAQQGDYKRQVESPMVFCNAARKWHGGFERKIGFDSVKETTSPYMKALPPLFYQTSIFPLFAPDTNLYRRNFR